MPTSALSFFKEAVPAINKNYFTVVILAYHAMVTAIFMTSVNWRFTKVFPTNPSQKTRILHDSIMVGAWFMLQ
jgi:hypothetical protein